MAVSVTIMHVAVSLEIMQVAVSVVIIQTRVSVAVMLVADIHFALPDTLGTI